MYIIKDADNKIMFDGKKFLTSNNAYNYLKKNSKPTKTSVYFIEFNRE